ncbi:MAG: DUF3892 domain-containing protein [Clostridium butyricum]|nr:DUF3892 domain-containing protein [Clostridium butyricum]
MYNETNMAISGLPVTVNTDISTANRDVSYSDPTLNLSNEDLKESSNKKSITALIKKDGEVTGYELSNGEKVSKEEAIKLAKSHEILGVSISNRNGDEYLRSLPDQNEENNLSSLPTINE